MSTVQEMRIDHFDGAYGPTIWLDVDAPRDLASLHAIFQKLASGDAGEVELCTALAARVANLGGLRLCLEEGPRLLRKRLVKLRSYERRSSPGPRLPSFVWLNSGDGWKRCAGIVAELIRRDAPGRRDLTEEGIDDAVVDLSFRAARAAATHPPELGWGASPQPPPRSVQPRLGVAESLLGGVAYARHLAHGFRGAAKWLTPSGAAGWRGGARTL